VLVVEDGVGRAGVDGAAVEGGEQGFLGIGEGDFLEGLYIRKYCLSFS